MTVRIEKDGPVWTVIHSRPEARNAMDPASADALTQAFLDFDADADAAVAVFWGEGGAFCAGWDLKFVSTLDPDHPLGDLDIPRRQGNGQATARTAAIFRADPWGQAGWNWTSRSSRRLPGPPWPAAWNLPCGAISG
jgi:enoyl-CoA hydratase/carnithine racemase